MDVLLTHKQVVEDYASYIQSFLNITDPAIRTTVENKLAEGRLWPEPLLQFNPAYESAGTIDEVAAKGVVHPAIPDILKGYSLYKHQVDAIKLGTGDRDFIVTSGTGSGKSLTYIGTIFHDLLSHPSDGGIRAVIVYPMNALINSQFEEFKRYRENYEKATGKTFPISFGQYTGQEKEEVRERMRENPPHVLLTNYMMLELLLTRTAERRIRDSVYAQLKYLVFDELHTYRGRQGADVAMLIRRIQAQCARKLVCIGTSATMASGDDPEQQKVQIAAVATVLFGRKFLVDQVVSESLARSLADGDAVPHATALEAAIQTGITTSASLDALRTNPLGKWLENRVALRLSAGHLLRGQPLPPSEVAQLLAADAGVDQSAAANALDGLLQWISQINLGLQASGKRYTVLPFKLHQFISQTGSVYTTLDQDENRFITLEPGVFKNDDDSKKPIFPNVFSRASGQAFICVTRVGDHLEPREFRESSDEDDGGQDGYLIIGDDIWDERDDLAFLPDSWLNKARTGPDSRRRAFFPIRLNFDETGRCSETEPLKWWGWFMRSPLLFDPTAGVFFDTKTNEGTKLMKLGSEGRSTSTTITTFSILNRLSDAGFKPRDQKLISFTDNRQDAALQAGHLNDFVQVVRLRAGIQRAITAAGDAGLTFERLGAAVFAALKLPFVEYGNKNEEPELPNVKRGYDELFQTFLLYRALGDLRRSWRIVLPNLEQCALLEISYSDLSEVAGTDKYWAGVPILGELVVEDRLLFLTAILDFFRLEYALHSENYLTQGKLREHENNTYDPEGRASAYWVMNDDPMRALDPELFMRDYFEPRLLPRLMECKLEEVRRPKSCEEAFAPIRPVDKLNRARPEVEFVSVKPEGRLGNSVTLRLRVSGTQQAMQSSNPRPPKGSGAFDLHVRLNGQLVARRPLIRTAPKSAEKEDLGWRDTNFLLAGTDRIEIDIPGVKLPHREIGGQVDFSAYAFNDDRVKGPTRAFKYPVPTSSAVRRRAFVVAIGAGAYEDKTLDLRYPAEDARKLIETVVPALRNTKRFAEVVPISLTSEWDVPAGERRVVKADATKARIRQVLESISGTVRDASIPQAPSTPDDTVIILFSGHGLNHAQEFYLVPYDSGQKSLDAASGTVLDLGKQISSAELAYWLRDLVADEIVLVIDACHSSASVETPDFKPGPMGARGFGQLAYDKGMRVLASTRPNDLAWESEDKGQGLLSYALLQEGLVQRKADRLPSDGTITIGEWLQYAADRVPTLYGEVSKGLKPGAARLVAFDNSSRQSREVSVDGKRVQAKNQQPSVFNFRRGQDAPLSIAAPKN